MIGSAVVATGVLSVLAFQQPEPPPADPAADRERAQAWAKYEAEVKAEHAADARAARALLAQVDVPDDRKLQVAFMGDSITHGSYASKASKTWTSRVVQWLDSKSAPAEAANQSVSGITSTEALRTFDVPTGQDLVFVLLGNNDIWLHQMSQYRKSYPALIDKIHAASPNAQVVCISPFVSQGVGERAWDVVEKTCSDPDWQATADIRLLYENVGNRAKVGDPYYGDGDATDDGHPNDQGAARIARTVTAAIDVTR